MLFQDLIKYQFTFKENIYFGDLRIRSQITCPKLLNKKGLYAELFTIQAQGYK